MNNPVLENLKTRRSIRKYLPRQVEPEKLDLILEAGTYAPTGMGMQSPVIPNRFKSWQNSTPR